ncbi:hypothetical protein DV515_00002187 [Chloebia gouldiae]|uniref:Uncharacterized protein n=1 Tax=Chloebia gouldiae TaxID=44316 RepID=A0A3L8SXE7_CHLGU|nr:hypothetical protein DV515_00002187 [Chloebia gouldiae]
MKPHYRTLYIQEYYSGRNRVTRAIVPTPPPDNFPELAPYARTDYSSEGKRETFSRSTGEHER